MLKEGDKAPAFDLESDAGGRVSLRDFMSGGKTLVLYFYPRDNTPGCTRQAQGFTAARKAIEKAGGAVVGVSRDSIKSHKAFREKCDLDITLLSDPDLKVHKAYGAWGEKTMYGKKVEGVLRTTFLIKDGKVAKVFPSVKVDGHADAVLKAIGGGGTLEPAKDAIAALAKRAGAAASKLASSVTKAVKEKAGGAARAGAKAAADAGAKVVKRAGKAAASKAKAAASAGAKRAKAGAKAAVKKAATRKKTKA